MNTGSVTKRLIILYLVVTLFSFFFYIRSTSAETIRLSLSLNPVSRLFVAENLAPGDQISSVLTVKNEENTPLAYKVSARLQDGSFPLYRQLLLKITDGGRVLYDGAVKDLNEWRMGDLGRHGAQNLTFHAYFPTESGNEFQGKKAVVAFDFVASGEGSPPERPQDPPTGTPGEPDVPGPPNEDFPPPAHGDTHPGDVDSDLTSGRDETGDVGPSVDGLSGKNGQGIILPKTSNPWYNMGLIGAGAFLCSGILFFILGRKRGSGKLEE